MLETGRPFQAQEFEREFPDGSKRFFTFQSRRIEWDHDHAALIILWDTTDLTSQQRQLAQLWEKSRSQNEWYRTVADFTYDWEDWIAPDGTHRYVSPSCERISGYSSHEFLAEPGLLLKITHPEDQPRMENHLKTVLDPSHGTETIDFRIISRGGEVRWINHICQPVFWQDGQWAGRRASNRDITERKQQETERERLLVENRTTLASIGDAVIATDVQGIVNFLNPVAERLTGWSSEEAAGQPVEQVFHIINEQTRLPVSNPIRTGTARGGCSWPGQPHDPDRSPGS